MIAWAVFAMFALLGVILSGATCRDVRSGHDDDLVISLASLAIVWTAAGLVLARAL